MERIYLNYEELKMEILKSESLLGKRRRSLERKDLIKPSSIFIYSFHKNHFLNSKALVIPKVLFPYNTSEGLYVRSPW